MKILRLLFVEERDRSMGLSLGTIYAQQFASESGLRLEGGMNPRGLTEKVRIEGADNDSQMIRLLSMEADKMLAIERQHGTSAADCECQNLLVLDRLLRISGFEYSQHIVAQSPQFFDDGQGKVFVRVQLRHDSGVLIVVNLPFNFVAMRSNVGPRVYDVLSSESRIDSQQVRLACPQSAGLLQHPYRNARPHNARFAPAHAGPAFDAGKRISQIADH
jgi:hypothetical protein